MKKKGVMIIVFALVFYAGIYGLLSFMGKYEPVRTVAGFPTHVGWQPAGIHCARHKSITGDELEECNGLGKVFYPLLLVDRAWIHPTRSVGADLKERVRNSLNELTTPAKEE